MDADPLAIGNPIYRVRKYTIPNFGTNFLLLENEFALMATAGYQVDKIIRWDDYDVLIVFIGWSSNEPSITEFDVKTEKVITSK
jgi:hypothetical protein